MILERNWLTKFLDLARLFDRVRQIESLRMEKEYIKNGVKKERVAYVDYIDPIETDEKEEDQASSVAMAELQARPPYVCSSLRPAGGKEKTSSNSNAYAFDIMKVD